MSEAVEQPSETELLDALASLQETARQESAIAADKLRRMARFAALTERAGRAQLALTPRVSGQPDDTLLLDSARTAATASGLGLSEHQAGALLNLAYRLTEHMPDTLAALSEGRIDLARARALADLTADCTDRISHEIEQLLLPAAGDAPWTGPAPRAWRDRIARTVATLDPFAVRERRQRAREGREVRAWPDLDGMGVLRIRATAEDIAMADQVVRALAAAWTDTDEHGRRLTTDQRRTDALIDLLRRARDGEPLTHGPTGGEPEDTDATGIATAPDPAGSAPRTAGTAGRRGREVGIVVHLDTLLGDGPAALTPGTLRGLGSPTTVDGLTARELADRELADGAGLRVLLTTSGGHLTRVLHLPGTTPRTRQAIATAVRAALQRLRPLRTTTYTPTATIAEHVHARNPHCTSYDCPRVAADAELDHDTPWPRGPTDADNLQPRCTRHHQLKTSRLVTTALAPDGSVATRMLSGQRITTRPEPLPGFGPAEGYARLG